MCKPSRLWSMTCALLLSLLILGGALSWAGQQAARSVETGTRQQASGAHVVKELQRYTKGGQVWRNVVVPRTITKEELISLAHRLHREDPTSAFRFFTDEKQFGRFMRWDQHYPNPAYPSPEPWVRAHYLAMLNRMAIRLGVIKWQLLAMDAAWKTFNLEHELIADLDDPSQ